MTLVVSDISSLGIVMVGDSAVTRLPDDVVSEGAVKVQYSAVANVGFALWGTSLHSEKRLDRWLSEFIATRIAKDDSVEDIGNRIASDLNDAVRASAPPWPRRGVHVAGFRDGLPVLFHVHPGADDEPPHEVRLNKDFPDNQNWTASEFRQYLDSGVIHLRNGYHPMFGPFFDRVLQYAGDLRVHFNIELPYPTLEARLDFYKLLVRFIAGTLKAARRPEKVNDTLSSIAFTTCGLKVDERLTLSSPAVGGHYDEAFAMDTAQ